MDGQLADRIQQAIAHGITYLHQHQYPNGEFCAYISADDPMQNWTVPDSTVFVAALIGNSLILLQEDPMVAAMLDKSIAFLQYQMERSGTWNHFTHLHKLRDLCPFDVDDTAMVCSLLRHRKMKLPYNQKLLLDNRAKNKLFYTWFTFRFRWNPNKTYWRLCAYELRNPVTSYFFWKTGEASRYDIDAVVNANLLYYLGDVEATQPIIQLLIKVIQENREKDCDTWYRNPFSVYYFFSRNYYNGISKLEPLRLPIIERITASAQSDGRFGQSVLDTALAVSTLLNLKHHCTKMESAIHFLLRTQRTTGEWERWLLYYGGPKLRRGWGSEELTTAYCLEALQRYHTSNLLRN